MRTLALIVLVCGVSWGTCPAHLEILTGGQSNMNPYFYPDGENGFRAQFTATCPGTTYTFKDCAQSGTAIADWQPLGLYLSGCYGFGDAATNVFLFYQGESDANDDGGGCIANYATLLTATLNDVSTQYSANNVYVSYAQISHIDDASYVCQSNVRTQQAAAETARYPMITTTDLTLRDTIHLDAASEYIVGQRFANEILALYASATPRTMSTQPGTGKMTITGSASTMRIQ